MSALDERHAARDLRAAVLAHVEAHGPCALGAIVHGRAKESLGETRAALLALIASGAVEREISDASGVRYVVARKGAV